MKKTNPDKTPDKTPDKILGLKDFMPKVVKGASHTPSPDDKVVQATAELASQHLDARTKAEQKADAAGAKMRAEKINEVARNPNAPNPNTQAQPDEYGGPKGLEPTRYGDWERAGRCFDF